MSYKYFQFTTEFFFSPDSWIKASGGKLSISLYNLDKSKGQKEVASYLPCLPFLI